MSRSVTRRLPLAAAAALAALTAGGAARAWWAQQHIPMTFAAAGMLPADVPEFFRKGAAAISPYSADPDVWKDPAFPALRSAEGPNHYLDLELLGGRALPVDRWRYGALCREMKTQPVFAGLLPYAIEEWYGRLALAFAEHRRWPDDPRVRAKVLYVAGVLAHYTSDAVQPLHTTVHFDGRVGADGKSPRSGIHEKVDALPEKLRLTAEDVLRDAKKVELLRGEGVFASSMEVIAAAHAKLDLVYRLEPGLPAADAPPPAEVDPEVRAFALERARAAAKFTAAVWYTAWLHSARIRLPDWHKAYAGG